MPFFLILCFFILSSCGQESKKGLDSESKKVYTCINGAQYEVLGYGSFLTFDKDGKAIECEK